MMIMFVARDFGVRLASKARATLIAVTEVHAADESDAVMIDHMRLWVGRRLTLRLVQKSGASYLRECIGLKCRWRLVLAALFVFDT